MLNSPLARYRVLGEFKTMTATTTCSYSNPVLFDGTTPTNLKEIFQFSSLICNSDTGTSSPAVYNGFTYGEIISSIFLFLILIFFLYSNVVRATKI